MERKALPPLLALLLTGAAGAERQTDQRETFSVEVPREWSVRLHVEPGESFMRIAPRGFDRPQEHLVVCSVQLTDDPTVSLYEWAAATWEDVIAEAGDMEDVTIEDTLAGDHAARVFSFDHFSDGTRCHQAITCVRASDRGYLISRGRIAGRDDFLLQIEEVVRSFRVEDGADR